MCVDIEKILTAEMKAAGRGSILHDGWSKFGDHYFALYASYMATRCEVNEDGGGGLKKVRKAVTSLLSVSPLHVLEKDNNEEEDEEDNLEEAATFTSQVHMEHIKDVFSTFYDIDLED